MGRDGFEPSKQVAADLQSVPFGHSGICPCIQLRTCIVYHNRCDYASIFFNYSEPPHAHSQNRTILVLYRRYAANFAHMCGGWLYSSPLENKKTCCLHASMTHQLFLFSIVLNSYYIFKLKRQPTFGCLLGEGIFTMGYSKNYIMYWGVFTVIIISWL